MLSTNVLCIKKRKKRSYCIADTGRSSSSSPEYARTSDGHKRSGGGAAAMLHITEDTPPDMLAGAMDLTVHLPTGRSVKMSVERSTPMMDLLVQITNNNRLQLSEYTLQALGMAPSSGHGDKILPFKPNTPIGALDTQHIRVVPKSRTVPVPKNIAPGVQPFESTFRLKVHLPRNQLYVTRVSQSVHLEDIMKKVCEEKNLDPLKYEFRHPANLDETLNPKRTLSDYQITEVYIVLKGAAGLNQAFTTNDIMALRKEEERKQMHNKTGGGVFNLIFRRGNKQSSGSLSSENRSISPTQSDDSRSVTPPAVQNPIMVPDQPAPSVIERPKPPQRKRRPAPKPPQIPEAPSKTETPQTTNEPKRGDTSGLTICHSRNSSDSSGYHEASILSDNCNTSLPRRPKSTVIAEDVNKISGVYSQSTSNLTNMSAQSKSTSSLAFANRKKKSAPPPPPPVLKSSTNSVESLDINNVKNPPSPPVVVASQPPSSSAVPSTTDSNGCGNDTVIASTNPAPAPRTHKAPPVAPPRHATTHASSSTNSILTDAQLPQPMNAETPEAWNPQVLQSQDQPEAFNPEFVINHREQIQNSLEEKVRRGEEEIKVSQMKLRELQKIDNNLFKSSSPGIDEEPVTRPPEVVAVSYKQRKSKSMFDSYTRKRGFQIGSSLLAEVSSDTDDELKKSSLSTTTSVASALNLFAFVDEIDDLDHEMFTGSLSKSGGDKASGILNQLHGMHDFERLPKNASLSSLRSVRSLPGFLSGGGSMKKWSTDEDLDDISLRSTNEKQAWVVGDHSDTESGRSTVNESPPVTIANGPQISAQSPTGSETVDKCLRIDDEDVDKVPAPVIPTEEIVDVKQEVIVEDLDWQYRLPSPPKAFRDSTPTRFEEVATTHESAKVTEDSVVTSPELFEKLKVIRDTQEQRLDLTSVASEEEKPILSKLSLEHLEKRKSLVYNRELATSLRSEPEDDSVMRKSSIAETFSSSVTQFEKTYEEMRRSSHSNRNTLPNFKITTYDKPKPKLNIFEDDTIRSNEKNPAPSRRQSEELPHVENDSRKNSVDEVDYQQATDYKFYRPNITKPPTHSNHHKSQYVSVLRSESLSNKDLNWSPNRPVTRSKSQVALNKYLEKNAPEPQDDLSKSNSLFDLQSIGVMRLIQTKLNTPTSSMEGLNKIEASYQRQPEVKAKEVQKEDPKPAAYHYRPSPSINMGTWSDRPKIPVNVKDDPDYKFGTSKLIVNSNNNDVRSSNTVEINNFNVKVNNQDYNKNVSIKVNGSEAIRAQNGGNVVIKIGEKQSTVNLRRPLGNLDKNSQKVRPHSIAFGSDSDNSRIPFVRSVELKKPYKDNNKSTNNNTSITPIFHNNNNSYSTQTLNRNYNNNNINNGKMKDCNSSSYNPDGQKANFRVNSFVQGSAPVVRGFRSDCAPESNRWSHQPHSFSTLQPNKTTTSTSTSTATIGSKNFNTKIATPAPFSQATLRRTEFKNVATNNNNPPPAPPPPIMSHDKPNNNFRNGLDSKELLLQSIRDFGGKKGLKAVKA